jgi:hypothetical protein
MLRTPHVVRGPDEGIFRVRFHYEHRQRYRVGSLTIRMRSEWRLARAPDPHAAPLRIVDGTPQLGARMLAEAGLPILGFGHGRRRHRGAESWRKVRPSCRRCGGSRHCPGWRTCSTCFRSTSWGMHFGTCCRRMGDAGRHGFQEIRRPALQACVQATRVRAGDLQDCREAPTRCVGMTPVRLERTSAAPRARSIGGGQVAPRHRSALGTLRWPGRGSRRIRRPACRRSVRT